MAAAPYDRILRAFFRNSSSPSFRLMELTIHFPWTHFRPASITSHFEESIMTGTRDISGSDARKCRKVTISSFESSMASSMLISITWAPSSTCLRAILRASSYFFSLISLRKAFDPATLQRSPMLTNKDLTPDPSP